MQNGPYLLLFVLLILLVTGWLYARKRGALRAKLEQPFPENWRNILEKRVFFYAQLDDSDKQLFEKRATLFLATKEIKPIETDIDDTIRVLVAASAIIPTFAFPAYNYPQVGTILIYPGSFDDQFQTKKYEGHKQFIVGLVGNDSLKGLVILSKPDLISAFDGQPHQENVGVHEFVHLLDKEDGAIDGIPALLLEHQYVGSWLHEIKNEIKRIESGHSDINPYALTNNAEFLAVVSEYFFTNPAMFERKHPDLYQYLADIFKVEKTDA